MNWDIITIIIIIIQQFIRCHNMSMKSLQGRHTYVYDIQSVGGVCRL